MTADEQIAAIVERTTREQGLDLEVRDPLALRQIAALILAAGQHQGGEADAA